MGWAQRPPLSPTKSRIRLIRSSVCHKLEKEIQQQEPKLRLIIGHAWLLHTADESLSDVQCSEHFKPEQPSIYQLLHNEKSCKDLGFWEQTALASQPELRDDVSSHERERATNDSSGSSEDQAASWHDEDDDRHHRGESGLTKSTKGPSIKSPPSYPEAVEDTTLTEDSKSHDLALGLEHLTCVETSYRVESENSVKVTTTELNCE